MPCRRGDYLTTGPSAYLSQRARVLIPDTSFGGMETYRQRKVFVHKLFSLIESELIFFDQLIIGKKSSGNSKGNR